MEANEASKNAGIVQIASGVVNLFVVSWVSSMFWLTAGGAISTCVMGVITLGLCPLPVGMLCGVAGIGIAIIAVFEIVAGLFGLTQPENARTVQLLAAIAAVFGILLGNPVSLVTGIVALVMLSTARQSAE